VNLHDDAEALRRFLKLIASRFMEDRCAQMAASLTYTTLLSMVPMMMIALTMFSAFPAFADWGGHAKNLLGEILVPDMGDKLLSFYLTQFVQNTTHLAAWGIVFLIITAMMTMMTVDRALNTIWHVSTPRALMQRILIYWIVLTLGPLLLGLSLSLTAWLVSLSVGAPDQVSGMGLLVLKISPMILITPIFILLFCLTPNRHVPIPHAIIGGVVSAVAFGIMNICFALYIARFPTYKLIYGAFSGIPIFLLWIYLSWNTVLLGAQVAASLPHWRSVSDAPPDALAQLYYAMYLLRMMSQGLQSGQVQTMPMFARRLRIGFDYLEQILLKLERANLVSKLPGQGWGAVRDPGMIRMNELYQLFVYEPALIVAQPDDGGIGAWLKQDVASHGDQDILLREVFAQAAGMTEQGA
jgi:membrane protein